MTPSVLSLKISGMTCGGCERHVHDALAAAPGVVAVREVSHAGSSALIEVAPGADTSSIASVATAAGYPAEVLPSRSATTLVLRPDRDVDLVLIGSGSASFAAAIQARELGHSVAMVEVDELGGTCVNVGCVPSKFFIRAAEIRHTAGSHGFDGLGTSAAQANHRALVAQKRMLVEELREAKYESVLESYAPIELVQGRGRLEPSGAFIDVLVGERRIRAGKVLVATGSSTFVPDLPGLRDLGYWTSTEALDAEELPARLLVLGGGIVGLELAQMLSRFGVRVTVVQSRDRLLPMEDRDVSAEIEDILRDEGIEILTAARATEVARDEEGLRLSVQTAAGVQWLRTDRILLAAGRRANTGDLGLERLGVKLDDRGAVLCDARGATSHPDLFAAGDVTAGPRFVYVAAGAGKVAATVALGGEAALDLRALPKVTFVAPQVASVGLSEDAARAAGHAVIVSKLPLAHVPRAIVNGQTRGFIKLVADADSDLLLGAHVIAPEAAELVHQAALILRAGTTVTEIAATMHAYLTWAEGLRLACQTFRKDVKKLSCCAA